MGPSFGKYNVTANFARSMKPEAISISNYTYELPEGRIAQHPLPQRDQSKLLVYKNHQIHHEQFDQVHRFLPANALLFFNDTKVIPARFRFWKTTGGVIEILLLQPLSSLSVAMETRGKVSWKCMIGNLKRWPDNLVLRQTIGNLTLQAALLDRTSGIVEFSWSPPTVSFAEVVHETGAVPLPPYLSRNAEEADRERYQTVYSRVEGAVAAPTAGLHFTESVLARVKDCGIKTDFLTLHVGAGTFQPVKTDNALAHEMHAEEVVVNRRNILNLLEGRPVVAVGTTSMRTLESIYWFGVKLMAEPSSDFQIESFSPYQIEGAPSLQESLAAIIKDLDRRGVDELTGRTSIYIFPGYEFRVCRGLITNFHQPGSTLLLLVAAFIGPDWKKIYEEALLRDYRFLSYGDSSILLPNNELIV